MHKRATLLAAGVLAASGGLLAATLVPISGEGFSLQPSSGTPVPVWSGGALLALDSFASSAPTVSVQDAHGNRTGSAIVSIPGATSTGVRSAARGNDGTIVAGGWTTDAQGRTAEILALVSPGGANISVSRVGPPFASRHVAVAADGSIWVQGFIGRNPDQVADADPAHGLIRHFDSTGKLLGSYFPEAQINDKRREASGFLAVSAGKVGWISWAPGPQGVLSAATGGYVEISSDGSVQQYPVPRWTTSRGWR